MKGSDKLISINPATGETISEFSVDSLEIMDNKIHAAHAAYQHWSQKTYQERAEIMKNVAEKLRENKEALGQLMTDEMGKPWKEAEPEVEKAAWCIEHYAQQAEAYLQDEVIDSDASKSYVHYEPLGAVLGIMPWNAPLWVTFRFLAPALMAGNTCVLKHDPHVQGCAEGIMGVFRSAGAPENMIVNLALKNSDVDMAIKHPQIQAVSFTGSSKTGALVAAMAASEIKPAVLELGGSDPLIVLQDADLESAANTAVLSRTLNAGQSCIAAKRIIVAEQIYDQFVSMLTHHISALVVGDPNDPETDIGPLARKDLRESLDRQVQQSIQAGAKCILGGEIVQGQGFFYPVTLLVDVPKSCCAMKEEVFGPVMVVCKVGSVEEALEVANATDYGLGAAIWTQDKEIAKRFIHGLASGQVAVNGIVKTDPRLPSGGIKRSGFGRELGQHGIKEFTNAKQVWIQ